MDLTDNKKNIKEYYDSLAATRDGFIERNDYYYNDLKKFISHNILNDSSVLEIGCGTGVLFDRLKIRRGVGIDISGNMVKEAKRKHPGFEFYEMDGEHLSLKEKFDYIIISDSLSYFEDIQKVFSSLKKCVDCDSRIIITFHNFLWQPFLKLAEILKLKMPLKRLNWLNNDDIKNLLYLENFEIVKTGQRFLFPFYVPLVSALINRYIANLPLVNKLCLTQYIIARSRPAARQERSVSVVVPARNEAGNIENALRRLPRMGTDTELIFIEGGSSDNTWDEIRRVAEKYRDRWSIRYARQDGQGKGDAVRKGFALAKNDILMILDADLTVPPEDLPKFYEAIVSGQGEYINGSRLVYPLEDDSMRTLNILGNKFFSLMFSWLLSQTLKDTLCGTKVISRENYRRLSANRRYFGDFDPFGDFDLIFGSAKLNLKIVEVPIRYQARQYGSTNISRFKHGWLLLKMTVFAMDKIKFI